MDRPSIVRAGLLTAILVIAGVASWEIYLRSKNVPLSYDDNPALWSEKRGLIYGPQNQSTVFIGSSRIKFDLDTDTWIQLTGDEPIQLACVGSSPRPLLEDLANDPDFKGRLIVDVTEPLFFSSTPNNLETPLTNIKYHKDRTPAQKASFKINQFLESKLVFLDKEDLSLNAYLAKLPIKSRPGVFVFPDFPFDFGRVKYSRQEYMTERFVADTNLQNEVKAIWKYFQSFGRRTPPIKGGALDSMLTTIKTWVSKIRSRGGQVVFVRTPSSDPMLMGENMGFPRDQYWERLLAVTESPGIHFKDYPAIAGLRCPELSHLSVPDAIIFTRELVRILKEEQDWKFPKQ